MADVLRTQRLCVALTLLQEAGDLLRRSAIASGDGGETAIARSIRSHRKAAKETEELLRAFYLAARDRRRS